MVISLMGFARLGPEKTMSVSALNGSSSFRIASARSDSGTRCSLPAFMRWGGTVQIFAAKSISAQHAPRDSPERAAVRMVNSRARAPMASIARSCAMKAGTEL